MAVRWEASRRNVPEKHALRRSRGFDLFLAYILPIVEPITVVACVLLFPLVHNQPRVGRDTSRTLVDGIQMGLDRWLGR